MTELAKLRDDGLFENYFCGIPMLQLWSDLRIWENLLNLTPVKGMLELGTASGGLTTFLALQCHFRGIPFATSDHVRSTHLARFPVPIEHFSGDMWSDIIGSKIHAMLDKPENHPFLLFCDGGDKPREFRTFAPWLHSGDIIGVHDVGNVQEFQAKDIEPVANLVQKLQLTDSFTETWFFRRV